MSFSWMTREPISTRTETVRARWGNNLVLVTQLASLDLPGDGYAEGGGLEHVGDAEPQRVIRQALRRTEPIWLGGGRWTSILPSPKNAPLCISESILFVFKENKCTFTSPKMRTGWPFLDCGLVS